MKKLLLISLLFISIFAFADSKEWEFPERYSTKGNVLVATPGKGCNSGEESFQSFLKKWNTSASFRKERTKVSEVTEANVPFQTDPEVLLNFVSNLPAYNILPLKAAKRNSDNWQCWFNVTDNTVGYFTTLGCYLFFERIDNKWFCVVCNLAG